ncbi:MAG: DUF4912 domain-containing protein [Candidatus Omnitrophica bacterium]|nr:DUF4912 domain-containing protein [Candidatus Omnitrophota bacterium]
MKKGLSPNYTDGSEKNPSVKELQKLSIKELKALAKGRGIKKIPLFLQKKGLINLLLDSYEQDEIRELLSKRMRKKKTEDEGKSSVQEKSTKKECANEIKPVPADPVVQHQPQPVSEFQLPQSYNHTKIVLMVRDPLWAYTYWDIEEKQKDAILQTLTDKATTVSPILRIYKFCGTSGQKEGSCTFWDIAIWLDARNWYVELGEPNKGYVIDLGLKDDKGNFYCIARSNEVRTPPDGPSDITDERWRISDEDFEEIYAASGGYETGISSGEAAAKRRRLLFQEWVTSGGQKK